MGKFSNVIIFSDFDGTFFYGNVEKTPEKNLEKIEYFKANGGHFTLSTGRLPSVMKNVYPRYKEVVNCPAIMGNGSLLYDTATDTIMAKNVFPAEKALEINAFVTEKFGDKKLRFAVYRPDGIIVENPTESDLNTEWFYKMWYIAEDAQTACDIRDAVREKFSDTSNAFRSWYEMTEICDITASKSALVKKVKDIVSSNTGIPSDKIITVSLGDFENDVAILKATDYSFCPENAIDMVKEICGRTLCHASKGAIGEAIDIFENEIIRASH